MDSFARKPPILPLLERSQQKDSVPSHSERVDAYFLQSAKTYSTSKKDQGINRNHKICGNLEKVYARRFSLYEVHHLPREPISLSQVRAGQR